MTLLQNIQEIYSDLGKTRANSNKIIDDIKSKLDIEFIGRGAHRAVFKQDDFVYKVPISSTGRRQNKDSFEAYNELKLRGHEDFVATVHDFKGDIVKQSFCPLTTNKTDKERLEEKIEVYGYEYLDWDESSVGYEDNTPVLIDIAGLKI